MSIISRNEPVMRNLRVTVLVSLVMVALGSAALRAQALFEQTDLFVGGQDDYNTYRGPSLLCTKSGTLLAFSEGKRRRGGWLIQRHRP